MRIVSIRNRDRTLVERVWVADRFWQRMRGLLGRRSLDPGQALFLDPCGSIHTFFMRFPLDLVFVDCALRVTRVVRDVGSFRIVFGGAGSRSVLEMQAGWLPVDAVKAGDELRMAEGGGNV